MKKIIVILTLFLAIFFVGCQTKYPTPSRDQLEETATIGGQWFLNQQNENFLYYEYYPKSDTHSQNYHPVREMAALWAITHLIDFTNNELYQPLIDRGLNYFTRFVFYNQNDKFAYLQFNDKDVDLGSSAFLLLSLLDSQTSDKDEIITGLADGILHQQNADGSLNTYFFTDRQDNEDYFPGEAILAIMTLYEKTGEDKYLQFSTRAFEYYQNYWRENPNTPFIAWHSRADYKIFLATGQQKYADFIFEINDYLLDQYHHDQTCQSLTFDKGGVTAVHLEGAVQALKLADQLNDEKRLLCYQNFINQGMGYLITQQVPRDTDLPPAAVGGIWDETYQSQRVDRNQHAVMAIMDYIIYLDTTKNN